MYKIFFDDRCFIITDKAEDTEITTKVCTLQEMSEQVAYFETAHQQNILQVLVQDIDEGFTWFCSSFKIIEAAGGLVQNSNNEYLMIYRFNHWDLPKGKHEKGESIEETAVREVEEECGINKVQLLSHIANTYHTYRHNDKFILKKTYWYLMAYNGTEKPQPQADEDIEKAEWVKLEKLKQYTPLMYQSVKEVFINTGILK